MKNYDWIQHVRGESLFVDDLTLPEGTLYAAVFSSPIAHGRITCSTENLDKRPTPLPTSHYPARATTGCVSRSRITLTVFW